MSRRLAFQKITFNIQNGLKLRAATQLASLINRNPDNIELRNELGKLYYDAGFYDAAGKFWIFNESREEHVSKCVELYEKSVNNSGNKILQDIKFRGDKTRLSRFAQEKLEALEKDSLEKVNHIPSYGIKNDATPISNKKPNPILEKLGCSILILILIFCVVSLIIGAREIFYWIF